MKKFERGETVYVEVKYIREELYHKVATNVNDHKEDIFMATDDEIYSLEEMKEKLGVDEGESFEMYCDSNLLSMKNRPSAFTHEISHEPIEGMKNKIIITIPKAKTKLQQVNEIVEMTQEQLDKIMGLYCDD